MQARVDEEEIVEEVLDGDESSEEGMGDVQAAEMAQEPTEAGNETDLTSVLLSWLGKGEPGRAALASSELPLQVQEENTSPAFSSNHAAPLGVSKCACSAAARYRCPGCGAVSCSLACVRTHKSNTNCSGVRDKVAYVPLTAMSDTTLRSDLAFLDGLQRDKSARLAADAHIHRSSNNSNRRGRGKHTHTHTTHSTLTPQSRTLISQARRRGVRLLLLPEGMSRRTANSSHYDHNKRELTWLVEWRIDTAPTTPPPAPAPTPTPTQTFRISSVARESTTLATLWDLAKPATSSLHMPVFHLVREPAPAPPQKREKRLEASHTLAAALSGETLLENPIIVVRDGKDALPPAPALALALAPAATLSVPATDARSGQ